MKAAVAGALAEDYQSAIVDRMKENGLPVSTSGRLTVHLAREFGFCYGVDRAVDYAYQARRRFEDRQVFLTGEIIHNPHVNEKLRASGIRFLSDPGESVDAPDARGRRHPAGLRGDRGATSSASSPSAARWWTPPAGRC